MAPLVGRTYIQPWTSHQFTISQVKIIILNETFEYGFRSTVRSSCSNCSSNIARNTFHSIPERQHWIVHVLWKTCHNKTNTSCSLVWGHHALIQFSVQSYLHRLVHQTSIIELIFHWNWNRFAVWHFKILNHFVEIISLPKFKWSSGPRRARYSPRKVWDSTQTSFSNCFENFDFKNWLSSKVAFPIRRSSTQLLVMVILFPFYLL